MKLGKEILRQYNRKDLAALEYAINASLHTENWRFKVSCEDINYILKKYPHIAVKYFSHRLSEENIAWIAETKPTLLKELFK